ncbi:pilus assembly protein N-terminal domain-containing protein [Mameliella alba]|nr:pilus assembly protein N-terminal domain-containing protein [Antarctobacter heliothermus]MBY6143652.1 pilus assembly protein N-terminal domain-containing protein [Mameliella alba]MCA0952624.1 pilus assembly protein N-terminal domain-containing protein [Mameliella alba]
MFGRFATATAGGLLLLAAGGAAIAQDAGFKVIAPERTVEVEVSTALALFFDKAFVELSMADPEVADIASLSDQLVYMVGKTVGMTTLTLISNAEASDLESVAVISYRDVGPMQAFLAASAKGVTLVRDGVTITVSGCLGSPREEGAVGNVVSQLKDWGYVTLSDLGRC